MESMDFDMNCPSESCTHTFEVVRMMVKPAKHTSYVQASQVCSTCGDVSATPKMRQKNTKNSNHAYNKYGRMVQGLWV